MKKTIPVLSLVSCVIQFVFAFVLLVVLFSSGIGGNAVKTIVILLSVDALLGSVMSVNCLREPENKRLQKYCIFYFVISLAGLFFLILLTGAVAN